MGQKQLSSLMGIYNEQLQLFQQLGSLTADLEQICIAGDFDQDETMTELTSLLTKRQQLMDQMDKLTPDKVELEEGLGQAAIQEHPQLASLKSQCNLELTKLWEANKRSTILMKSKLAQVGQSIDKIQAGKHLNKAYNQSEYQNEGFFFDRRK